MADELLKYDLLRLDGGLNEGLEPTHIQDSELAYSRNFYTRGGSLIHRNGLGAAPLTDSAAGSAVTGVFLMKTLEDEQRLLVFTTNDILKCEGGQFVSLNGYKYGTYAVGDEIDITPGYDPWSLVQYNGYVYAARPGVPKILAVRGDSYHWSRVQYGSFVVGEEYGAGSLPAGDYWCLQTFVNDSNQEGSLYDASSETLKAYFKVTITASKAIRWFPTAPIYAHQKKIKLYRSYKDSFGTFYHLATLDTAGLPNWGSSPPAGVPFYDNTPDASLGTEYDDARDYPPENIIFLCIWGERLWAMDEDHLYCSYPLAPMVFDADFTFNFGSNEHPMRGMVPFRNVLLVGKTGEVWYMSGTGASSFAQDRLTGSVGVMSGYSLKATRDYAFWYGGDDFYRFDGSSIVPIGRPRLKEILDAIPTNQQRLVQSWLVPEYGWYCSAVPQPSSASLLLVYDYAENKWHVFEYGNLYAPSFAGPTYGTDYNRTFHAGFANGHLYQWNTGKTDAGTAISGVARTKSFGFDTHAMLKFLRDLSVHCPSVADNLTIKLFGDDLSSAIKTRTISLENLDDNWKPVAISNMQHLGTTMALQFEYSGDSEFSIDGISFRLVPKQRRRRPL
ncbi:MAG: hypothetical protein ACFFFO_16475 [Candidatus Thorarchaeota archaeon]